MPVPSTEEIRRPLLEAYKGDSPHYFRIKELMSLIAEKLGTHIDSMSPYERRALKSRINDAQAYLMTNKLISNPLKQTYMITRRGTEILETTTGIIEDEVFTVAEPASVKAEEELPPPDVEVVAEEEETPDVEAVAVEEEAEPADVEVVEEAPEEQPANVEAVAIEEEAADVEAVDYEAEEETPDVEAVAVEEAEPAETEAVAVAEEAADIEAVDDEEEQQAADVETIDDDAEEQAADVEVVAVEEEAEPADVEVVEEAAEEQPADVEAVAVEEEAEPADVEAVDIEEEAEPAESDAVAIEEEAADIEAVDYEAEEEAADVEAVDDDAEEEAADVEVVDEAEETAADTEPVDYEAEEQPSDVEATSDEAEPAEQEFTPANDDEDIAPADTQELFPDNIDLTDEPQTYDYEENSDMSTEELEDYSHAVTQSPSIDDVLERHNSELADNALMRAAGLSPEMFSIFVIDLLSKMGYNAYQNARYTSDASGNSLIQGVILDLKTKSNIYIHTSKLSPGRTVGRADVKDFASELAELGGTGIFATTGEFSEQAAVCAQDERIMLIDGQKLATLMINHNFCVNVERVFEVKELDDDSFSEYE